MGKAKTVPVVVTGHEAETGAACEIEFLVPAEMGSPPTARAEAVMNEHTNKENWKGAVRPFATLDKSLADEVARCYDWYMNGHELTWERIPQGTVYIVSSKGYYYYCGA